jgi:hypothetical protein
MERGQQDEVIVTQQLMSNFLRLLQALNQEPVKGDLNEEE